MNKELDYQALENSSTAIKSSKSNMESVLQNVDGKIESINDPEVWKSSAAQQLHDRFKELSANFAKFTGAVDAFAAFVDSAVEENKKHEEENIKKQSVII